MASSLEANHKKARIALVGAGWWSQGWHLPHLHRNPDVELVAIVDTSPHPKSNLNPNLEPLATLADKYGAQLFSSVSDLLNDPDLGPSLDGVVVATPHTTHFDVGKELIAESMRRKDRDGVEKYRPLNILMEKPMTTDVHDAKELHELVKDYQQNGGRGCFLVNHSANFRVQAIKARQLIESGEIGNIRFITAFKASPLSWIFDDPANKGWNEPTSKMLGNGFSWGQCSHLLAWLFHACPSLTPLHVFCAMNHSPSTGADVAHAATIVCNSESDTQDVVLSMSGTSLLPGNEHADPPVGKLIQIKIFGTKGSIVYSGDDNIPTSGRLELRKVEKNGVVELPCGEELGFSFENLEKTGTGPESLQSFVNACLGRKDYYRGADSAIGLRTVQVLEAMYRSSASHKLEDVHYV